MGRKCRGHRFCVCLAQIKKMGDTRANKATDRKGKGVESSKGCQRGYGCPMAIAPEPGLGDGKNGSRPQFRIAQKITRPALLKVRSLFPVQARGS